MQNNQNKPKQEEKKSSFGFNKKDAEQKRAAYLSTLTGSRRMTLEEWQRVNVGVKTDVYDKYVKDWKEANKKKK